MTTSPFAEGDGIGANVFFPGGPRKLDGTVESCMPHHSKSARWVVSALMKNEAEPVREYFEVDSEGFGSRCWPIKP